MGRYYTGDIEGKFWFGVQPSDDPSFFGGRQVEDHIEYWFDGDDSFSIDCGIAECVTRLGSFLERLDGYFGRYDGYNDRELSEHLQVSVPTMDGLLEWYARLELGEKIRRQVDETGRCRFEAEL